MGDRFFFEEEDLVGVTVTHALDRFSFDGLELADEAELSDEAEFEEEKHPRDPSGKFASGGGGGQSKEQLTARIESFTNKPAAGTTSERVQMRGLMKQTSDKLQQAHLKDKIAESFARQIKKEDAKGNAAKVGQLQQKLDKMGGYHGAMEELHGVSPLSKSGGAGKDPLSSPKVASAVATVSEAESGGVITPEAAHADLVAFYNGSSTEANRTLKEVQKAAKPERGLHAAHLAHVANYTGAHYVQLNAALRNGVMSEKQWGAIRNVNYALGRMDKHVGTAYRARKSDKTHMYKAGTIIEERAFVSASRHESVAKSFGFKGTIFQIQSKTGAKVHSISQHPDEAEVLFKSGTRFRVTKVDTANRRVHLEEV